MHLIQKKIPAEISLIPIMAALHWLWYFQGTFWRSPHACWLGDGFILHTLAKNLLEHGQLLYAESTLTLTQLPAYPALIATIYALGEGDRIVGISAYTLRPPEAKETKPVVSAFLHGSVKKICALEPDVGKPSLFLCAQAEHHAHHVHLPRSLALTMVITLTMPTKRSQGARGRSTRRCGRLAP